MDRQARLQTQIDDHEQKIRYLLSNIDDPWLRSNKASLTQIMDFFRQLIDKGLSSDDMFDQFLYVEDLRKIAALKTQLTEKIDNHTNSTDPALLAFQHSMRYGMDRLTTKLKDEWQVTNNVEFEEMGMIRISTQPNKMYAIKDNVLFDSTSTLVQIKVVIDEAKYYISFNIGGKTGLFTIPFDTVVGLDTITHIINTNDLYIKYTVKEEIVTFSGIGCTIDLNEVDLSIVEYEQDMTLSLDSFKDVLNDIPIGVIVYTQFFETTGRDPFTLFYDMLFESQVNQLSQSVINEYEQKYSKDISYGLYGQGAMIGVSQVYELAKTSIRAVTSEYELKNAEKYTVHHVPESFTGFKALENDNRNKINIIGNSLTQDVDSLTSASLKPFVVGIPLNEQPPVINYQETGGRILTGFNIAMARLSYVKGTMTRYLSDGTVSTAQYWIETTCEEIKVPYEKERGTYGLAKSYVVPVTFDGLVEMKNGSYSVHGFRVNVLSSIAASENEIKVLDGYKFRADVDVKVKLIIWPENLAGEGESTTPITLSYKRIIPSEEKDITDTYSATKTKIKYGDKDINVYVVNIDSYTAYPTYYSGASFNVSVNKPRNVTTYTNRNSSTNEPLSLYTSAGNNFYNTFSGSKEMIVPTMGIATSGNTVRLGRCENISPKLRIACCSELNATAPNVYVSPVAPWSTAPPSTLALGWVNLSTDIKDPDGTNLMATPITRSYESIDNGSYEMMGYQPITLSFSSNIQRTYESHQLPRSKPVWTSNFNELTGTDYSTVIKPGTYYQQYIMTKIDFNLVEVVLPSGVLNQGSISESIVKLERAVEYLQAYATYLSYLIENLDARLTQVEETLAQVVDIIMQMMGKNKTVLGIVSDIVGFIGTGVGMFFPLIGLSISIAGQILKGADAINEGDIVTGSIDIITGGIMVALGLRKWNNRLKKKYGQQQNLPANNDGLPTYEQAVCKPGYGCISINRNADVTAFGAVRNVWYEFLEDELIIHGDTYPVSNLQLRTPDRYYSIKVEGNETWESKVRESGEYSKVSMIITPYLITMDEDANITNGILGKEDIIYHLGINASPENYAFIIYTYAAGSTDNFSKSCSFDQENLELLLLSNGSKITGNVTLRTHSKVKKYVKNGLPSKGRKWNIKYLFDKSRKVVSEIYSSPICNVRTFFDATNPYIQSMTDQTVLFDNLYQAIVPMTEGFRLRQML